MAEEPRYEECFDAYEEFMLYVYLKKSVTNYCKIHYMKILLGISGGIAAYKCPDLVRLLVKGGAEVKVVMTENAQQFVTPLSLQTVSKNPVYSKVFSQVGEWSTEHISYADWGDVLLIAPASANIIGKMANGIADDALSTTFLAFNKPVYMAPAMNDKMYEHPMVQMNINTLKSIGVNFIEPTVGELACGVVGKGKMEDIANIAQIILNLKY